METRSKRRRLLQSYISSQWPDLPAIFESLNDDTLTTILEFVGKKSYRSFGGVNKRCKEVYLAAKGMTKETFLFGYGPLSRITDRIERSDMKIDQKLQVAVGKGVVFYNRRDVMDWALEERNTYVLNRICTVAALEERYDLLEEVLNAVGDWGEIEDPFEGPVSSKRYIFRGVDHSAVHSGKLNMLKWLETHQLDIEKEDCACAAAIRGRIHTIQWLREERGLQLDGWLYNHATKGGHLHVMKWLREQEVPWYKWTFHYAATEGKLDILQWLHDEGCPWVGLLRVDAVKPEVGDWLRVNGYPRY